MSDEFDESDVRNERKSRKNDHRRKSILSAAKIIFLKQAFEDVTIDSIAEASAVSKATLYQYFSGKSDIYESILLIDVEELVGGLEDNWSKNSSFFTNIRRMTYFYIAFFIRHQEYFSHNSFFFLPGRRAPMPDDTTAKVRALLALGIGAIANSLNNAIETGQIQAVDSRMVALAIWSLWEGSAWAYATGRSQFFERDVYDIAISGVDLIAAGLSTSAALPPRDNAEPAPNSN